MSFYKVEFFFFSSTFMTFFFLVQFYPVFAIENEFCEEKICNVSSHKRCYETFETPSAYGQKKCKCLKGLYQVGDDCLGVIRYDMEMIIFRNKVLVDYILTELEIKKIVKNIPKTSAVLQNYEMDSERSVYKDQKEPNKIRVLTKLLLWKKNQESPIDLPKFDIELIKLILIDYFNKKHSIDANKFLIIETLNVGQIALNTFLNTVNLKYNELTCSTDQFNYCSNHELCTPTFGGVKCRCDTKTSVDVSPEKELFPGENCEIGCPKECQNGGICRYKDSKYSCYCSDVYVGETCQIHIIWFIIIVASLIIILSMLSCTCGVFEFLNKKNDDKKKRELKKLMEEEYKEKRF